MKPSFESKFVVIESPYRGGCAEAAKYLDQLMREYFAKGQVPVASHAHYTRALNDADQDERKLGMEAGWALNDLAYAAGGYTALCLDLGISRGMIEAMRRPTFAAAPLVIRGWSCGRVTGPCAPAGLAGCAHHPLNHTFFSAWASNGDKFWLLRGDDVWTEFDIK